jgi:hypothetical protein
MKPENDNPRIYSTLQEAGLWRIYKPTDVFDAAYTHDVDWFVAHARPKRSLSIRARIGKEFETVLPLSNSIQATSATLWVWVIELSVGLHAALPIWRGDAFFRTQTFKFALVADLRSDGEIAVLLDECSRRVRVQ